MSDTEQRFNQHIANHMECVGEAAGAVAPLLGEAADAIVETLLSERQVLVCGSGKANAFAQYFSSNMLAYHETERPALPVINLGADATTLAAIGLSNRIQEVFSRQIQALGHEGDSLLLLTDDGNRSSLIQALQAAHDRGIRVIAVTGRSETDIHALFHGDDIDITLPDMGTACTAELMVVILNALCAEIETRLFSDG